MPFEPLEPLERLALVVPLLPLRLRDAAEVERRFDELVFGLLRELLPLFEDALALRLRDALLFDVPLFDALLFGLDPFELLLFDPLEVFRFVPERERLWAIAPP